MKIHLNNAGAALTRTRRHFVLGCCWCATVIGTSTAMTSPIPPDGASRYAGPGSVLETAWHAPGHADSARTNGAGSLDVTFDPTGNAELIGIAREEARVLAVAAQPDGKLLVAGEFIGVAGVCRNNVARLNADGSLDLSFSPGLGTDERVEALALQADGGVLLGGYFTSVDGQRQRGLARLHPDGLLDLSFNPQIEGTWPMIRTLAIQPDGKILIGGNFDRVNGTARTDVARLYPDGSLDESFDCHVVYGAVTIRLQPDGKILAGGYQGEPYARIVRLMPNGSVDSSFRPQIRGWAGNNPVQTIALQPDGRIVIGGVFDESPQRVIARLNANGTYDTNFVPALGTSNGVVHSVALQSDGKILVGGLPGGLVRLNPNGSLTPGFATGCTLTCTQQCELNLFPQAGGRIVAVGRTNVCASRLRHSFAWLNPDGSRGDAVETSFYSLGVVRLLAAQPDGRVLVAGDFTSINAVPRPGLARLQTDGRLDASFDPGTGPGGNASWNGIHALVPQSDGKVLIGGRFDRFNGVPRPGLARLHPAGSVDLGFVPGSMTLEESGGEIGSIAVQRDGRILVGGAFIARAGALSWRGLVRLHTDAAVDSTFAPMWIGPAEQWIAVNSLTLQPDDRILIGGNFDSLNGVPRNGVARLNANGGVDLSFNPGSGASGHVFEVLLQPGGQILVAGDFGQFNGVYGPGLVRLQSDGGLDTGFLAALAAERGLAVQPDGKVLVVGRGRLNSDGSLDASFDVGTGLVLGGYVFTTALQPDGRVLVGGQFTGFDGIPCSSLARLNNDVAMPFVTRRLLSQPGLVNVTLAAQPPASVAVHAVEDQPPAGWTVTNISHGGVFDLRTGKVKFGPFFDHEPRTLSYSVLIPPGCIHGACGQFTFTGTASTDGLNTPITGDALILVVGMHPADFTPADWRLVIQEITAYGAAWRRGSNWPVSPVPIPIDYVTRAAALWQGGECYEVDSHITNAPLWWVNCDEASRADRSADFQSAVSQVSNLPAAQRQVAPCFIPGEPLTVTLAAQPGANVRAFALEDSVPAGWTVSAISDGGEFDSANRAVKWGPFFDTMPRTVSYSATPPAHTSGSALFAGVMSFDGSSLPIAGSPPLREACRLELGSQAATGQREFLLTGRQGARFVIEASNDLLTWETSIEVTNTTGRLWLVVPVSREIPHRFFRARLIE